MLGPICLLRTSCSALMPGNTAPLAHKAELVAGVLVFSGEFDLRDVEIAQRVCPGRRVVLNEGGGIEIHPAGDAAPPAPF